MASNAKIRIAGIWLIVCGVIALTTTGITAIVLWVFSKGMAAGYTINGNLPLLTILLIGLSLALPAFLILLGGLFTLQKRHWSLALAGAVCALLYFNLLALPALVMLIMDKNKFYPVLSK